MIIGAIAFLNSVGVREAEWQRRTFGRHALRLPYLRMGSVGLDAGKLIQRYQEWKLQRAKKIQVYCVSMAAARGSTDRNPSTNFSPPRR
jgi:hypothetical protein